MPTTTSVDANGFDFVADVTGPADGDLVLLLHGFPQTRYAWRAELEALADAGLRACAFDQRGYSPGARPESVEAYRVDDLVQDVLAVADAFGSERFHLVGHDWGGQVAWVTAALHPDRVTSLAVISRPHPASFVRAVKSGSDQKKRSGHHRRYQAAEVTDELLADDAAKLRSTYTKGGVPVSDAAAYLETLGQWPALDAALNWYRAAGMASLRAGDTPKVSCPTLYVWGTTDRTVSRQAAEGTAECVTGPYRFVEIDDVGHFVTDEAPAAFPPLLLEHLSSAR